MLSHQNRVTKAVVFCLVTVIGHWSVPKAQAIESDDFNACALNNALWSFVDPLGDSTVSLAGTQTDDAHLVISVPEGIAHDMEATGTTEARVMQPADNTDFEVRIKIDSEFDAGYQMVGMYVEQNPNVLIRYILYFSGDATYIYAGTLDNGVLVDRGQLQVPEVVPFWLGIKRVGDQWTLTYSLDGATWSDHTTFAFAMTVTRVGPAAGNFSETAAPSPAFTARIDYFLNTAAPFVQEDGPGPLTGYGITTAVNGNGSIAINPNVALYYCGETVTLTAVAQAGWAFTGWSGDAAGDSNPTQVVMNADRNVTAEFVELPTGSLKVNIAPAEAVAAGAKWRVNGGPLQDSGAEVSGLIADVVHTVTFSDVAGWDKPANVPANITANETTIVSGTYTAHPVLEGSVRIVITPNDAIAAGAQWTVDAGAWLDSGAIVGGLSVGNHVVSFKAAPGWVAPANLIINVVAGQMTSTIAAYTASTPTPPPGQNTNPPDNNPPSSNQPQDKSPSDQPEDKTPSDQQDTDPPGNNVAPPVPMCGFGMVEAMACSLFCLMVGATRRWGR